MPISYHGV